MFFLDNGPTGLIIDVNTFSMTIENPSSPARVVLSVPHDGFLANDFAGLLKPRSNGWKGRDIYTWPIAKDVLWQARKHDVEVSAVRFLMARAYVDANREVSPDTLGQTAFDDPRLANLYRQYHWELEQHLYRAINKHGKENVLLLDVHGFGKQPKFAPSQGYDLILGTANRSTINHGEVDRKFAAFMEGRDYSVFLPAEKSIIREGDPYSGGHITRLYAKKYDINAIQVEISPAFRGRENQRHGEKLAADIAMFLSENYR